MINSNSIQVLNDRMAMLLAVSIILTIFRFPIMAALGIDHNGKIFVVLPLLIILLTFIFNVNRLYVDKRISAFTLWFFFSFTGMLLFVFFYGFDFIFNNIRYLSSTVYISIFWVLLFFIDLQEKHYNNVLKIITNMYLVFGSLLICSQFLIVNVLGVVSFEDIFHWLYPFVADTPQNIRFVGFLVSKEFSILGLIASWAFVVKSHYKSSSYSLFNVYITVFSILTFFSVMFSDSITSLMIYIFIIFCLFFTDERLLKYKKHAGYVVVVAVLTLSLTPTLERVAAYALYKVPVSVLIPDFKLCTPQHLFITYFEPVEGCISKELHFSYNAFRFGIWVNLGWFILLVSPIYYFFKDLKRKKYIEPSLLLSLPFSLSILHYSGSELWGNNYLFLLGMLYYLKYSQSQTHTTNSMSEVN